MSKQPLTLIAILVVSVVISTPTIGSDCTVTSVGFTPLTDLGAGFYSPGGTPYQGGLYPGGSNVAPSAHAAAGRSRALAVEPLDTLGNPNPIGKYVLLSIGMSNTTQEFCSASGALPCDAWTFMGQSAVNPRVNTANLVIANGALGGQSATTWDSPADQNYSRVLNQVLTPQGLTEAQVQAVWIKVADPGPTVSLPNANADAFILEGLTASVIRAAKVRYPNLKLAFLSNRIYAGYAGYPVPTVSVLNPEPYAYESGFAMKWLIEAQINQMSGGPVDPIAGNLDYNSVVPWIGWGPDLWADGTTIRSDGLQYVCADLQGDGTHPAMTAEQKVGFRLLTFMLTSRFAAPWFRKCEPGDMNADGVLDGRDVSLFASTMLNPIAASDYQRCSADCNDDGSLVLTTDTPAFVLRLLSW
jgi:hypothetical protein